MDACLFSPALDLFSLLPPELCLQVARHLPTCADVLAVTQTSRRNWYAFHQYAYEKAAATLASACLIVHWAAFRGFTRVIDAAYSAKIRIDEAPRVRPKLLRRVWDTPRLVHLSDARWEVEMSYDRDYLGHGTPMHAAALAGRLDVIQQLLAYGADPGSGSVGVCPCSFPYEYMELGVTPDDVVPEADDWTPAHVSLCAGQAEVAQFFLVQQHPAPMSVSHVFDSTPLHAACVSGNIELIQWLHTTGRIDDVNERDWRDQSPVVYAYLSGHQRCVRYLLSLGADINQSVVIPESPTGKITILKDAIYRGRLLDAQQLLYIPNLCCDDALEHLIKYTCDRGWLDRGQAQPRLDHAALGRIILDRMTFDTPTGERQARLNKHLGLAAAHANWGAVEALVECGAMVNSASHAVDWDPKPSGKETPLYWCIYAATRDSLDGIWVGPLQTAQCLLKNGADPNLVFSDGQWPALWLVYRCNEDQGWEFNPMVELYLVLLKHGARPQRGTSTEVVPCKDQIPQSPLEFAVWGNRMTEFEHLLKSCGGPQALGSDDLLCLWETSKHRKRSPGGAFGRILELDERDVIARLSPTPILDLLRKPCGITVEAVRQLIRQGAAVDPELEKHDLVRDARESLRDGVS